MPSSLKMQKPQSSEIMVNRQHRQWLWPLLLIVGLGVAVTGGSYWLIARRSPFGTSSALAAARFLPTNTVMAVTATADPEIWQQLRQLGTPTSRALIAQELTQKNQDWLTENGYNWERDIQPWLGRDVTLAWVTADQTTLPLLLLPLRSSQTSVSEILAQLKTTVAARSNFQETTYKGVPVWTTTLNNKTIVSALVDSASGEVTRRKWVVASPSLPAVQQSIDALQSPKNLAQLPGYGTTWNAIGTAQPLAQIYINIPLAAQLSPQSKALTVDRLAQLQQQQGIAMNVSLDGTVLKGKGLAWWRADTSSRLIPSKTSPSLANLVPDSTIMMVAGDNLTQLWQDYLPLATNNPAAPVSPAVVRETLQVSTGLNLETNILTWSKSEFGAAWVPAIPARGSTLGGALLLLVKSTDRAATESTFTQLDQTVASRYQLKVEPGQVQQQEVINWSSAVGGVSATHGWLNNDWVFLSLGVPIVDRFLPKPAATLASNPEFQRVMKSDISPFSGQFYLEPGKMRLVSSLPPRFQAIGQAIEAIGVTSNATSSTTQRFDLAISLKQIGGTFTPPAAVTPTPQVRPASP